MGLDEGNPQPVFGIMLLRSTLWCLLILGFAFTSVLIYFLDSLFTIFWLLIHFAGAHPLVASGGSMCGDTFLETLHIIFGIL